MKIGFLHIGSPEHGVCRYGRLIAAEAHKRNVLDVIEENIVFTSDNRLNRSLLIIAAQRLSQADVVHFQYNKGVWGKGLRQLYYLWLFKKNCTSPMVATVHDVYPRVRFQLIPKALAVGEGHEKKDDSSKEPTSGFESEGSLSKNVIPYKYNASSALEAFGPTSIVFRLLPYMARLIFVCSEEEKRRLKEFSRFSNVKMIPHFVEDRKVNDQPHKVRKELGFRNSSVITLLGFIHSHDRKGHKLVVESLPNLPHDVNVVFAGGASHGSEEFVQHLKDLAQRTGVASRFRVTGYLSEDELNRYLVATKLAICPFKIFSASGSLSTWISVEKPILASDQPQIAEYNQMEPNAIKVFKPYSHAAFVQSVHRLLPLLQKEDNSPVVSRLRQQLSLSAIVEQHMESYRYVAY